jgi:hypothetical protein
METPKSEPKSLVRKLIHVTPEQLIETGQRLRQWAMDQSRPGDCVILEFTDSISLVWQPTEDYHRSAPKAP